MKRALLSAWILAAGLLGGCTVHSEPTIGDIYFYWRFQDHAGNLAGDYSASNTGCDVAGATTIEIVVDGASQGPFDCVQSNGVPGVGLLDFEVGVHSYALYGFRGTEEVFATGGNVDVRGGQNAVDTTLVAEGSTSSLVVYYSQNGTFSCAGTPDLVYEIDDRFGNPVDIVPDTAPAACDSTNFGFTALYQPGSATPTTAFPYGPYTFRYLELVDSGGTTRYAACAVPIDHEGFTQLVDLAPTTTRCP